MRKVQQYIILLLLSTAFSTVTAPVTDIDGNVYETVLIGEQLWMQENLKVTHYNNGDEIPTGFSQEIWENLYEQPAYCFYDESLENYQLHGALYNGWTIMDDREVCPIGWHIPSDDEWTILTEYLGGLSVSGGKMKQEGYENWLPPNIDATNESDFTALPSGYRVDSAIGFIEINESALFWSNTDPNGSDYWIRKLRYDTSEAYRWSNDRQCGLSIRCLADEIIEGCTHPNASNYDEEANVDDGSCLGLSVNIEVAINPWSSGTIFYDSYNKIGLNPYAHDEYDEEYDYPEPPINPHPGAVSFSFPHPEWGMGEIWGNNFTSDIRELKDVTEIPEVYNFQIISNSPGYTTLSFDTTPVDFSSPLHISFNDSNYKQIFSGDTLSFLYDTHGTPINGTILIGGNWGCVDESACNYTGNMNVDYSNCEYNSSVWYVSLDGNNDNCGSLEFPLLSIQEAIDYSIDGDTILVSAGTYYENINFNGKNISVIGEDRETTIIDGTNSGRTVEISNCENSTPETLTLENFTIINGYSTGGGGVYIYYSNPMLRNLNINNNEATVDGGGIHSHGGIPILEDLNISNNIAGRDGAGLYIGNIFENGISILSNCTIYNNNSDSNGGGVAVGESKVKIINSEIRNNFSYYRGGGLYIVYNSQLELTNSLISSNQAINDLGGGVEFNQSSGFIQNCVFLSNSAPNTSGVAVINNSTLNIEQSLFAYNIDEEAGRGVIHVHWDDSYASISNVTITENISSGCIIDVTPDDNDGNGSNANIKNSIIYGNQSEFTLCQSNEELSVSYSNIYGNWEGEGNINADPQFTAPDNGDFTLQSTSPCIDEGDPSSALDPDGTRSDMGAYPFFQIPGCIDEIAENYDFEANIDDGSCLYLKEYDLNEGANLVSFLSLPDDASIGNVIPSTQNPDISSVIGEGEAASLSSNGVWIGNLNEISLLRGYWIKSANASTISILANERPGHTDLTYSLHFGANLISFPFDGAHPLTDVLPPELIPITTSIIGEGEATSNTGNGWVGNLTTLQGGRGYWFKLTDDIEFQFVVPEERVSSPTNNPRIK